MHYWWKRLEIDHFCNFQTAFTLDHVAYCHVSITIVYLLNKFREIAKTLRMDWMDGWMDIETSFISPNQLAWSPPDYNFIQIHPQFLKLSCTQTNKCINNKQQSCAIVSRCGDMAIIQDGGRRHLEFVRTGNSTIRSAIPENPTLETNMNEVDRTTGCRDMAIRVCWGHMEPPFWRGRGGHRGSAMVPLERAMVVSYIGSPLWPLRYLLPFGRNLRSNVSDAQITRVGSLWAQI